MLKLYKLRKRDTMPLNKCHTDLSLALQKLKAREESIAQIEELSNLGSWEINLENNLSTYSDNLYNIYGFEKGVDIPSTQLRESSMTPEDTLKLNEAINKAIQTKKITKLQSKMTRKSDGKVIDILISGKVIFKNGVPSRIIGSTQDITKNLEIKRHSDELSNLIQYSSNEVYIIDKDTYQYLYANQGALDALGYTLEELLQMSIFDINPNLTKIQANKIKKDALHKSFSINRSIHQRKDHSTYHVQAYIHPLKYNNQDTFVLFDTDISEIIELEEKLIYQANHDLLTNLPNRALFKDRLSQALKASARNKEQFAILFIDLDKFKQINDSLGHDIGDKVLIEASTRIRTSIRDEDTLARIGGDEFVIILRNIKESNCSAIVAKKIIHSVCEEMEIDAHTLFISASIGIAQCPTDATNESSLVKFADIAMYKAKETRDSFIFYHEM